jgi:hypothetical protein
MTAPPLDAGGVKVMAALASPAVAFPMVGALGAVGASGVATTLAEFALVPMELVAVATQL